ncbi:transposase [Streptomyces phaeolivaceus]|uniref:transposase n=1 Tax=Streptomyces phaeolivaceus TaxID=2653200 RepID=UPI00299F8D81|nr:transposase [Streptomyces phaeolivaceus]
MCARNCRRRTASPPSGGRRSARARRDAGPATSITGSVSASWRRQWGHLPPERSREWGSTGRGIALEDLTGIRERARLRKPQRVTPHSWSFHQLGRFIAYKAKRAGVPVVHVDPAYSSRECPRCHHIEKANRPSQAVFVCRSCGFAEHADRNASHDISHRGWYAWVRGAESQAPALTLIA